MKELNTILTKQHSVHGIIFHRSGPETFTADMNGLIIFQENILPIIPGLVHILNGLHLTFLRWELLMICL